MNLYRLLVEHPADGSDALAHTLDTTLSKAEVLDRVDVVARQLEGVDRGQPVAVIAESVEMLVGMFACWKAGAVFVPVNPRQPSAARDEVVRRTRPAAVITSQPDGLATQPIESDVHHPAGTAFVMWTSGTTGRPKAVLHGHHEYLEIIDRVLGPLRRRAGSHAAGAEAGRASPNLIPVSMALNAGIYNALFGLRAGAPLVFMARFEAAAFATLVRRHGIRSTVLPPAAMVMLSDDDEIADLAPLRYVRSITAPLSPFQARRFTARFGVGVLNGYGQAEIGEVIGWTAADLRAHPEKVGAAGRPHPGVELRLGDPDSNGVGELLVRPPSRALSYADGDQLDDRLTGDGFVRTGDLALIDDDGFVWIEGRLGDVINRGGNKVFPADVEEVLRAVAGVDDVAVAGRVDDRLGEVPVAYVVGNAAADDLEAACREHLAAYKVPVAFEFVDALPRSEAGKVLRSQLG